MTIEQSKLKFTIKTYNNKSEQVAEEVCETSFKNFYSSLIKKVTFSDAEAYRVYTINDEAFAFQINNNLNHTTFNVNVLTKYKEIVNYLVTLNPELKDIFVVNSTNLVSRVIKYTSGHHVFSSNYKKDIQTRLFENPLRDPLLNFKAVARKQDKVIEQKHFNSFDEMIYYIAHNFLFLGNLVIADIPTTVEYYVNDFLLIEDFELKVKDLPYELLISLNKDNQALIKIAQLLYLPQNQKRDVELQHHLSLLGALEIDYTFMSDEPFNNFDQPVPLDKVDHINQNLSHISVPITYKKVDGILDKFPFTVVYD